MVNSLTESQRDLVLHPDSTSYYLSESFNLSMPSIVLQNLGIGFIGVSVCSECGLYNINQVIITGIKIL